MGRVIYKIDSSNGKTGTIVLTGQPGIRKEPEGEKASGKHLEFVFFEPKNMKIEVDEEIIKNFFFAYYDHDRNQQKDDWKWRKAQLDKGEKIPVFFRKDTNGEIIDMGLTQLYKITYKNSIVDLINNHQKESDGYDLAETIFGFVEDKKALKGRVHFGHAFMTNQKQPMGIKTAVLAGPKASYYPNYVDQKANKEGELSGKYDTYMNSTAKIRGWKRYPARTSDNTICNPGTENVATQFNPLPADSEFSFNITYHNLRKEELGALISALTFHNTEGLFHSIGSAKPLGYGKVHLEIENLEESTKIEMLKSYELLMDSQLGNSSPLWFPSQQIMELMAMAKPGKDDKLEYMKLKNFINAKGRWKNDPKFSLPSYSNVSGNKVFVKSLTTLEELNEIKSVYEDEKSILDNQEDISTIQNRILDENRRELGKVLEQKKDELLVQLNERKQALIKITEEKKAEQEAKEKEAKRDKEAKSAESSGLIINSDLTHRKAFDNISKEIMDYIKTLHKNNNDRWLQQNIENGKAVQESDYKIIIDSLKVIYKNLPNKNEIKKWNNPFDNNHIFKKVTWWLGSDLAQSLYNDLTKNS